MMCHWRMWREQNDKLCDYGSLYGSHGVQMVTVVAYTYQEAKEVEGTPAIKTETGYFDKDNAKLIANLIELCGTYLPDSKEEE